MLMRLIYFAEFPRWESKFMCWPISVPFCAQLSYKLSFDWNRGKSFFISVRGAVCRPSTSFNRCGPLRIRLQIFCTKQRWTSHTCVSESGWVVLCLRAGPNGLYGMPEACRAFATSHQGMPLCISPFRGRAETLSLFVYRSAEAHTCIVCCASRKKSAGFPWGFKSTYNSDVEMMNFGVLLWSGWCVNYVVGPLRVVWGPAVGAVKPNIAALRAKNAALSANRGAGVALRARAPVSECALVRVTMIEYSSLSAASLFFARSPPVCVPSQRWYLRRLPVRSKHLYVGRSTSATVCCFFAVHNDQIYSCELPRLFFGCAAAVAGEKDADFEKIGAPR